MQFCVNQAILAFINNAFLLRIQLFLPCQKYLKGFKYYGIAGDKY